MNEMRVNWVKWNLFSLERQLRQHKKLHSESLGYKLGEISIKTRYFHRTKSCAMGIEQSL